jgi:uncharacterized cupin superfamily protein
VVPSSLFGAEAPSNKITVGFIGVGSHGVDWNLSKYLKLPASKVVMVCDVDGYRMRKAKAMVDAKYDNEDCAMTKDRPRGWFVASVRELPWQENELGATCEFDKQRERFEEFGINLTVLRPGQPMTMYHREGYQEGFLVLSGECLLLVEGEERPLEAWDYFHCPAWTEHVLVGASDGPSVVLAVGARKPDSNVRYPASEVADAHGAGVPETTESPKEAYAPYPEDVERPYREGDLPEW